MSAAAMAQTYDGTFRFFSSGRGLFGYSGGLYIDGISGNWTATLSDSSWVKMKQNFSAPDYSGTVTGSGTIWLIFQCQTNTSYDQRQVTLSITGATTKTYLLRQDATATVVNSASYTPAGKVARDSLISIFGAGISRLTTPAIAQTTQQISETLGNDIYVIFRDSSSPYSSNARMLYVSANQINALASVANHGSGDFYNESIDINNPLNKYSSAPVEIVDVLPAIFTANAYGSGPVAGHLLRVKTSGAQIYEPLVDSSQQLIPIAWQADDVELYLVLYGTGWRHHANENANPPDYSNFVFKLGGVTGRGVVEYGGPQGGFVGQDQLNVRLIRSQCVGLGEVGIDLIVDGIADANPNPVTVKFQ
ncbi:MAG TPA: hypothetical protein VNQ79_06690 [Blastocatellia bacterium]|nr:hypothetical protein [Blastocatellia bacterium]